MSAAVYAALFVLFVWAHGKRRLLELSLAAILVVGPPLYYPIAYFLNSTADERVFVKTLAELWGPFWAALSAICLLLVKDEIKGLA